MYSKKDTAAKIRRIFAVLGTILLVLFMIVQFQIWGDFEHPFQSALRTLVVMIIGTGITAITNVGDGKTMYALSSERVTFKLYGQMFAHAVVGTLTNSGMYSTLLWLLYGVLSFIFGHAIALAISAVIVLIMLVGMMRFSYNLRKQGN